jgi:hypothetical protein
VRKRVAAAAAKTPGQPTVNVDSLRRRVQREIADSIAKANQQRAVAVAPPVAAPVAAPVTSPAAPSSSRPPPPPSGKSRLAITNPRESNQPALNSFSRQLIDALRLSLDQRDAFDLVDQDSVRDAIARTRSRDEAAKILKPDVMVSPGYVGSGDTVNIVVTVWDLRSNSSYGIRVTSTKFVPSQPESYLGPIVQSVLKQLDDLSRAPTIYRR